MLPTRAGLRRARRRPRLFFVLLAQSLTTDSCSVDTTRCISCGNTMFHRNDSDTQSKHSHGEPRQGIRSAPRQHYRGGGEHAPGEDFGADRPPRTDHLRQVRVLQPPLLGQGEAAAEIRPCRGASPDTHASPPPPRRRRIGWRWPSSRRPRKTAPCVPARPSWRRRPGTRASVRAPVVPGPAPPAPRPPFSPPPSSLSPPPPTVVARRGRSRGHALRPARLPMRT